MFFDFCKELLTNKDKFLKFTPQKSDKYFKEML